MQNLNFENESQLEDYIKNFNLTIEDLKRKIEIENEWKNLIYSRYKQIVKIDKDNLIEKIERASREKFLEEYNLSEIVFTRKKDISLDDLIEKINESIEVNGFENTANLYSISDSSKVGGKLGWIKKRFIK